MSPRYTEFAIEFECASDLLFGIVSKPAGTPVMDTAFVIIVGGPQYRVGSHRQFVLLARHLAQNGYAVLRFDYRGMGDGTGDARDFSAASGDIRAALDALNLQLPIIKNIVLWGLCDGASAALLYLQETPDARVAGLCLVNPWIRSTATQARTQLKHYYTARLRQKEFWLKLINGKVAIGAVQEIAQNIISAFAPSKHGGSKKADSTLSFQSRMALAWQHFPHRILLLLSEHDLVAKEFMELVESHAEWANAMSHPGLERHDLLGADHTCSDSVSRAAVEQLTLRWQVKSESL